MTRRFLLGLAGLVLLAGTAVGPAAPATAHPGPPSFVWHHSELSFWTCGVTKGTVITTISYDWPYHLEEAYVGYTCDGHWHNAGGETGSGVHCSWQAQLWWNGATSSGPKSCTGF